MDALLDPKSARQQAGAARRIALAYGLVAAVWIVVADIFLDALSVDASQLPYLHALQDGGLVVVTMLLMYGLLNRELQRRQRAEDAVRAHEREYRGIFEATSDGLIINDLDGYVVEANPAVCQMHGYSRDEFIGLHPTAFIQADHHAAFAEFVSTVRAGRMFHSRAVDIRKDGSAFHVDVRGTGVIYKGQPHLLGVVRDVSQQVEAYQKLEERVEERTRELSTLLRIAHQVASTLELKPLLGLILEQIRTLVDYNGATVWSLVGNDLVALHHAGSGSDETLRQQRLPLDHSPAVVEALRSRQTVVVDDVWGDSPLARAFQAMVGADAKPHLAGIHSLLSAPLIVHERVIGVLTLGHAEVGHYSPRQAELVLAIAQQAAVAVENARLYEQARTLAALQERQRLARELHDSVSQALYGIALGARTARALLDEEPGRAVEPVDYVLSLAEAGLAEMRALLFELRPESLAKEGLVAALAKQAASLQARHKLSVDTDLGQEPNLPLAAKECLYRIAQEALQNTIKHARASRVRLWLSSTGDGVQLEVSDDGVGFQPGQSFPGHLGLLSMQERAAQLGGRLEIASRPGAGTLVRATVPANQTSS